MEEPTHYWALQNPNILDLVITNNEGIVGNVQYLPPLGKSHHPLITFELLTMKALSHQGCKIKIHILDKVDYDGLYDYEGVLGRGESGHCYW